MHIINRLSFATTSRQDAVKSEDASPLLSQKSPSPDIPATPPQKKQIHAPNAGRGSLARHIAVSQHPPQYSRATIGEKSYEVTENTPENIKQFLSMGLSNNTYTSLEHLEQRANAYLQNIEAEKKILANTAAGLNNPSSNVSKQSAWMAHLERGTWARDLRESDRERLGAEAAGTAGVVPMKGSPFYGPTGLKLSDNGRSGFAMMLRGEHGPLTLDQTKSGFEYAQTGQVAAGRLQRDGTLSPDRENFRKENRVDAVRSGTHFTKTETGLDLKDDKGTQIRDAMKAPVMSGTSGSSSDGAIAAKYAAQRHSVSWAAPGLSESQAAQAMADLSLNYFRGEKASPAENNMRAMNALRRKMGDSTKTVDEANVFSHSYPEIYSGIKLTLDGSKGDDVDALKKSTKEAIDRLGSVSPPFDK